MHALVFKATFPGYRRDSDWRLDLGSLRRFEAAHQTLTGSSLFRTNPISRVVVGQPSLFQQGSAHRRMRFLLPRSKTGLRELFSGRLPPWQLSKANFHALRDESPDLVEAFKNTFAAWRFGVQPLSVLSFPQP
jgi:hypothetical protein